MAGSERQKSAATEGKRLKEGSHINKSLLTLGQCIDALADISNGKSRHVHYRDSKLTLMLKDSLGGNAKSTLIATVTQSQIFLTESISTLRFASRARLVKNNAQINQLLEAASVQHLQDEIKRLTSVIEKQKVNQGRPNSDFEYKLLKLITNRCEESESSLSKMTKMIENQNVIIDRKNNEIQNSKMVAKFLRQDIKGLQVKIKDPVSIYDRASVLESENQVLRNTVNQPSSESIQYMTKIVQLQGFNV